ncbi:leucine--tRNA ligase [Blochmannia endosymbiont of Colobopsis nipponica]|uniref:leucine--tRNA ligase n=1 Tax=Blochmannia endosymbiont of Colobopsis nipponica TaxID=2681987 RepID=UPI0017850644|nr:leucine--tRNA ligase [Blochmannia endosymbiont of Colobopsis nipponica]
MQEFYSPKEIETKIQKYWEENKIFQVKERVDKKKFYCLSMLPYPSGKLHIGHVRNYTIGDVISRYQRMLGKNVLYPIGWDAFGLPAEQAANKNKKSPAAWTYSNINYMKKQLKMLGFSYDWSREITTCKPEYYRWEQWFFNTLYQKGLVYKKNSTINWCPQDQTVLANEQVVDGCCWRCNSKIEHKNIPQWFIKITNYSEQLLHDLNKLKDWPIKIKDMQKNWIGRSEGFEIIFKISNNNQFLKVYATNIKKLMEATYITVSINHPFTLKLINSNPKLTSFIQKYHSVKLSEVDITNMEKQGVYSNFNAIHPVTNQELPIWITNFLFINNNLTDIALGTPISNKKDWAFATKYNLPITTHPIKNNDSITINSINSNNIEEYKEHKQLSDPTILDKLTKKLINLGIITRKIKYRLRDWCISRQRYWGVPIPMITLKNNDVIPVAMKQLPVILPEDINIEDNFKNPLINNNPWKNIIYNGDLAIRETDTFDTFIESSWYYARHTCPNYDKGMLNPNAANYWLPIDQYVGGIEHAVMHLMYFRFFHKLMRDLNLVNSDEPAKKLLCQGMVLNDAFYYVSENKERIWVNPKNVSIKYKKGKIVRAVDKKGHELIYAGMLKMSKSKNNGVDPQMIVEKYGADTVRLFVMFAAPPEMPFEWKEAGIKGAKRFLNRIWKLTHDHIQHNSILLLDINNLNKKQTNLRQELHKTIAKVTHDIENRQMFNTAISSIMEFVNQLIKAPKDNKQDCALMQEALNVIIRLIYPFTPHIAFVLWKVLGNKEDIDYVPWPNVDLRAIAENEKKIIIQFNGKFYCTITMPINSDEVTVCKYTLQNTSIKRFLKKNRPYGKIFIKNKLLNIIQK